MTELLLDTSVILPFTRSASPVAQRIEEDYRISASTFRPLICVVTLGEVRAFARAWGEARTQLLTSVLANFAVVSIGRAEVIEAYAELHHLNLAQGLNIGQNDLWIAAAAKSAGLPVLTSDRDLLGLPEGAVGVIQVNAKTGSTETVRL